MTYQTNNGVDPQNRGIEQKAETDADLETIVPPTSPLGGMTTWVRVGVAALAVLVIIFVLAQAI